MLIENNIVEFNSTNRDDMQDIGAIPVFTAIIEQGSFSKAAVSLGLTKSAVSKRITGLEAQLGVRLLNRSTRKLSLTEAGERYYIHAQEAVQAADEAERAATELQKIARGTLRVVVPMSFGLSHLAPLIPKFLQQYPQITFHMEMSDNWIDIIAEGIDIAIRTDSPSDAALIGRKLVPLRSVLCASPDYLTRCGTPQSLSDITQHNCLLYNYHTVLNEWVFSKDGAEQTIRVAGNYQVNNSEALRQSILQGLGIGRLPTFVAGEDIKAGRLVPLMTAYKMPHKTLYAIFPQKQYLPERMRVFIDFIAENFKGENPSWDCW